MPAPYRSWHLSLDHPDGRGLPVRATGVLLVALLVGAGLAALKGRGLDAAYVLGNSSAAYLLLPFLAGWVMSRRAPAIALGVIATQVALVAFYFTASTLYLGRLSLDFSLGRWFLAGAVSGTVLSLLGHTARQHGWLLYLVPVLLLLEPATNAAAAAIGLGSGVPPADLLLAAMIEIGLGVATLLLLQRRLRPAAIA